MTINQDILDSSIRHMVWVERYKAKEVKRILKILEQADDDLVSQIAARMAKIEKRGYDLGVATTERLNILLDEIREQRKDIMRALYGEAKDELVLFAEYEAEFQERLIVNSAKNYGADLTMIAPAAAQLKAVVTSQPFQGRLLKEWFSDLGVDTARRLTDAVKIGIVEGQTTDQIVRRIRGTKARGYSDGVMAIGKRNAEAIVRTAISHVGSRASDELYDANADLIKGVRFVATLDSRTSCFVKGTLVKTHNGLKAIDEIKEGDFVIGGSGKIRRVEGAAKFKKKNLIKLNLSNGESLICTSDHKFLMDGQVWREAKDLLVGQKFAYRLK